MNIPKELIISKEFIIQKYLKNNLLELKVIPNSSQTKLVEEESGLKLYLHAVPDKNKANLELIKFFKKELGLKVKIKSGMKSRNKVIHLIYTKSD